MTATMPCAMPLPPVDPPSGKQPRIFLFGDSHSHAVHLALEKRRENGRPVPLTVFRQLKEKNGRRVGNISLDDFLDRISGLRRTDVVLSMLGGGRHAVYSTTQHSRPFDVLVPGRTAVPKDEVEIIPYRVLHALLAKGTYKRVGRRLKQMREATEARVVHFLPPPPKRDNAFLARHHEKLFEGQGISDTGVSPPELRLKFWLLQAQVLQKLCSKLKVELLKPPTSATEQGFLRPECFAEDTTHANHVYGELVLRSVETQFLIPEAAGEEVRSVAGR